MEKPNLIEKEYEYSCPNCAEKIVLESGEIEKGEFECPECNSINKIEVDKLVELANTDDENEIVEVPKKSLSPKTKKLVYIGSLALLLLIAFYYYASKSDSFKFLNAKEKSEKHLTIAVGILQRMMDNSKPNPDSLKLAMNEADLALSFESESFEANYIKAIVLFKTGKFPESLLLYDKLIKEKPDIPDLIFNRAIARMFNSDLSGAIDDLNKILEISPDHPLALYQRGSVNISLKNYKAAITDYNKLLELGAEYPDIYYGRGNARLGDGQKDSACYDFVMSKALGNNGDEIDSLIKISCGNNIPKVKIDSAKLKSLQNLN